MLCLFLHLNYPLTHSLPPSYRRNYQNGYTRDFFMCFLCRRVIDEVCHELATFSNLIKHNNFFAAILQLKEDVHKIDFVSGFGVHSLKLAHTSVKTL